MGERFQSGDDSEECLSSNPPKEAPPPPPSQLGLQHSKPLPSATSQRRILWARRGSPPPVPPRTSDSGQAKNPSFKNLTVLAQSLGDIKSALGKHTSQLEILLARQDGLQQDMKELLEIKLEQSQAFTAIKSKEREIATTLVSSGRSNHVDAEGQKLELLMRQAADLVYQAKMKMMKALSKQ